MGEDFTFMKAEDFFHNTDNMINYYNENEGAKYNVELRYSTPSDYVDAIKASVAEKNINFPVKYDDMFPYKDNSRSYWTGYFTSRPQLKSKIREVSQVLHASDKLFSLAAL